MTPANTSNLAWCRGRHVVAVLLAADGSYFIGTNGINTPRDCCPRQQLGHDRGSGWELCREVCGQAGHAEAGALQRAGTRAQGGLLLLVGHETICTQCRRLLAAAGVRRCIIIPDPRLPRITVVVDL